MKWIGGTTAVISLVMGMSQVHGLYSSWKQRGETVSDLIHASRLQRASGDFGGAWSTIQEALQLDAGSPRLRDEMADAAMQWLHEAKAVEGKESFSDIVTRVAPTLYVGLDRRSAQHAADLHAHIGWANFLRYREGVRGLAIDEHYHEALALDPENPFAHAMYGHWLLWNSPSSPADGSTDFDAALQHFARGLSSGREPDYVRHLQLAALANHERVNPRARVELVRCAIEMCRDGMPPQEGDAGRVLRVLVDAFAPTDPNEHGMRDEFLNTFPPNDLFETYRTMDDSVGDRDNLRNLFVRAALLESCGSPNEALALLRQIREGLQTRMYGGLEAHVNAAFARIEGRGRK